MNKSLKFFKKIINFIKLFIHKIKQRKIKKLNTKIQKLNKNQPMGLSYIDARQETNVLDVDLIDDNASEKDKKKVRQYTKKWVDIILTVSLIDVQMCFVLAFLGKDQIAETLGIAIITEIVAIGLGYMLKAFFETNSQKKNELEMERIKHTYEVPQSKGSFIDENESVG